MCSAGGTPSNPHRFEHLSLQVEAQALEWGGIITSSFLYAIIMLDNDAAKRLCWRCGNNNDPYALGCCKKNRNFVFNILFPYLYGINDKWWPRTTPSLGWEMNYFHLYSNRTEWYITGNIPAELFESVMMMIREF